RKSAPRRPTRPTTRAPGAEGPLAERSYMTTTQNTPARSARPARQQAILTVLDVTEVSPRLVRIRLGGDTFDNIVSNDATDKYVTLLFADPAHGLVRSEERRGGYA